MTGFAAYWLRSTCFYDLPHHSWQHPLVHVGNALSRAWSLGPALAKRDGLPAAKGVTGH